MEEKVYDHNQIELKWEARWKDADLYRADPTSSAKKYYVVEMLPYPSGRLHMGHVRITRSAMRWRVTCGCAGTTCSIRWVGTRSDCPLKTPRSRAARILATGR